ncbi:2-dehydropantoate 2-reductase N-terminal domain-containing protein [Streptomyces sp. NBC_01233]
MRILTVGAGAVGGFFGARLAAAGQDSWPERPRRPTTC